MKKLVAAFGLALCACGGDSNPIDGGADVQTNDVVTKDVVEAGPQCGTSAWLTYGHDAARTFASDGCIVGPLTPAWTYSPAPKTNATVNAVHHALAATDAVYLQWANSDGQYIGTTAADGISTTTHMRIWTYDSGSDANMGNWASVSGANLVLNDDGMYWVSLKDGTSTITTGVDWWGQTIADNAGGAWFVTTSKSDGPGLFVGEIDATAKVTWSANKQGTACGDALGDKMGGIALDGGVLFYAPQYSMGGTVQPTYKSGLYAFDATTGTQKWKVDTTTPSSTISAGNGLVYLIESGNIVARKQTDGSVGWTKPLAGAGSQAPVIAGSIVIAASGAGVSSFDATTGTPGWSTPLTGAAAQAYSLTITNGCSGSQNLGAAIATTMAAAIPSGTLVVTATGGVHVLSLSTGQDTWSGKIAGAKYTVHDPVIVGKMVYVVDSPAGGTAGFGPGQLIALSSP
jgi:outer membrane protein assembly factor BamB